MDVSFLTSNRFWAMAIGVLAWYGEKKGYLGLIEMQAIAMFISGFIGIKTVDRLGEKAGTTTLVATPIVSNTEESGK